MYTPSASKCVSFLLSFVVATLLVGTVGCGIGAIEQSSPDEPQPANGFALQGHIHGGQQPITGATIQLYAAGSPTSGGSYGGGAVALIPSGSYSPGGLSGCVPSGTVTCTSYPTTDSTGSFTITNEYSCPSATSQVYLVATGGNPGNSDGNTNAYISLMSALGSCSSTNSSGNPSLSSSLYIEVNEVSTIASVYALQQFMSAPAADTVEGIGAPGNTYNSVQTAVVGLSNAFSMVPNLVNIGTGTTPGTNTNVVVETSQINTLADILSHCINSDPTVDPTSCSALMSDATPSGSTLATDTLQAAYYMIQNPYNNVANLFKLVPSTGAPFAAASTVPYDFTLAIQYEPTYNNGTATVPAIGRSQYIVIDAYGNAWISQNGQTVNSVALPTSVVEIGPTGNVLMNPTTSFTVSSTGGIAGAFTTAPATNTRTVAAFNNTDTIGRMAVDLSNNVWFINQENVSSSPVVSDVAVFTGSSGSNTATSGSVTGYYVGSAPSDIAVDASGDVFVASVSGSTSTESQDSSTKDYANSAVDKFVAGSGSSFTSSVYTVTTQPHSLPGGVSPARMAIGQYSGVTNTYGGGSVTNDGSILWVVSENACADITSTPVVNFGVLNQYTTKDLLPTAYSEFATSYGATSRTTPACTTADSYITSEFAADTSNVLSVAVDRNDNLWIPNQSNTSSGTTNGFDGLTYIVTTPSTGAVDPNYGSVTLNFGSPATTTYGTIASGTYYGLKGAYGIAIDGNNNAWVGNQAINIVSVFSSTLGSASTSPSITFTALPTGPASTKHQFSAPVAPAIDPSGNVWVPNWNTVAEASGLTLPVTGSNVGSTITILVGAAAPVVTPLAVAVANKVLGTRP